MRKTLSAVSIASLAALLLSCSDATTPITEESDQQLAATVAGAAVDPNAETMGGHTTTMPTTGTSVLCTLDAVTKTTTCTSKQNGLDITREIQFFDGAGNAQQRPDSNTRSMRSKTTIAGTKTITTQTATGTTTVNRVSNETVTGLAPSSTQRVVNGTASGTENSELRDTRGTVTVRRQYADTTRNLTLPSPPSLQNMWPVAGTVVRNIQASVAVNDGTARTYTTREERTHEAGGKLTIKTTMNGQTRTCVIQLGDRSAPVCTQS